MRAGREDGRVGPDGVDQDALMAGDAGVGVGKVKGKKGGEPAEGAGRVIMVGGAEDEGVVGAAVGAGRARAGAKHGGSLCAKARASLRWGERRHRDDTGHRRWRLLGRL